MSHNLSGVGPHVLVSDFDGTMTRRDFYRLTVERLVPAGTPDYWSMYRRGQITHFEALRRYFSSIRAREQDVLRVVESMELDPEIGPAVDALRQCGWRVIVASAGCAWYIQRLLAAARLDVEVHANPGRFELGRGLIMEMPSESRYVSEQLGIDKAAIVRHELAGGGRVAFAGDGFPDADAARLVPDTLRFARDDLAAALRSDGLAFRHFENWSDIARILAGSVA